MTTPRKRPGYNAHALHHDRMVERCPLPSCGKTHLPYTKTAKAHRRRASRLLGWAGVPQR